MLFEHPSLLRLVGSISVSSSVSSYFLMFCNDPITHLFYPEILKVIFKFPFITGIFIYPSLDFLKKDFICLVI